MEIPDRQLIKVLDAYMEEYDFGNDMPTYDPLAVAENIVAELFHIPFPALEAATKDVLAHSAKGQWGSELLKTLQALTK